MAWYAPDRFRTQGLLIGLASLSMALLAAVLVQDAWRSTRNTLIDEAQQQCATAVREMQEQFIDRASLPVSAETDVSALFEAEDVSLRGLSTAVLRSYEGMEGGFLIGPENRMAGHPAGSFNISSTADLESEARLILDLAGQARATARSVIGTTEDGNDLLVGSAMAIGSHNAVAWVMKRLSGANDPAAEQRRWWLAGLVLSAVLGLALIVSTSARLRQGVERLHAGLARLENDFAYRLPPSGGDFGDVAEAINRMAERRGALEATLRRQDRLAALGRVVAGVAHEIRNPLNSLRLTLELLDRRVRKGAAAGDEVRQAMQEVDRLDQILGRLLTFGRFDLENRQVQDVRPLIERALRIVDDRLQRKRIRIALEPNGSGPLEADVDAPAIEQILINLLLNAIDASPEGSTVRVAVAAERQRLRIEVADQGPGIQPGVRDQIFNPYFTTKENGTGLGLAVSREIAGRHGGSLDFESGEATVFVLQLPFTRSQS